MGGCPPRVTRACKAETKGPRAWSPQRLHPSALRTTGILRFTGKLERKGDFWQGERSLTRCASRSPLSAAHTSKHPHSKEHPGLQLSRHPEAEVQAGGRPWVPCVTVLAPRGLVPSWAELAGVGGGCVKNAHVVQRDVYLPHCSQGPEEGGKTHAPPWGTERGWGPAQLLATALAETLLRVEAVGIR